MTWLGLSEIAEMTGGVLQGDDQQINSVSTDSRTVQNDQLFIALVGENFDAHDFVASVENKAAAVFVHKKLDCELPQIIVDDTLKSLAVLAAACRKQFKKPVIGLTGSNGKTTVKEMLAAILACKGNVMATFGNLNNDIGMPLTLLRLRDEHDYAVIEMGANHFGEIDYLSNIAQPDVAILNNAGAAHLEGFGDVKGVSRAKAEIFNGLSDAGVAVVNADDQYADYWLSCNKNRKVITFGFSDQADVQGEVTTKGLLIQIAGEKLLVKLALLGRHNAMNALAASAAAMAIGFRLTVIRQGLESLQAVKGRLALMTCANGIQVVDDTYNANPDSARAAIDVLAEKGRGKRVLVLGDMAELGDKAEQLHHDIGVYAKSEGVDMLYCLGDESKAACKPFAENGFHYNAIEPLLEALQKIIKQQQQFGNEKVVTVLVKGSRSMQMEHVVEALVYENNQAKTSNGLMDKDNSAGVVLC
ncbi:MAG: UDP-N-acetylmuramoyl-tripeptide--D-alanyl-D-alanine ligase [Cocleimonas sp.]|nr:UDP-N-acetylmuramoyl-tripeptide--D-alanyl-D-alanine ligase [Cocleimonas sp.]